MHHTSRLCAVGVSGESSAMRESVTKRQHKIVIAQKKLTENGLARMRVRAHTWKKLGVTSVTGVTNKKTYIRY